MMSLGRAKLAGSQSLNWPLSQPKQHEGKEGATGEYSVPERGTQVMKPCSLTELSCNAKTCLVAVKEAAVKKRLRPSSAHKPETVLPCQGWTVTGWVSFKLLVGQHHAQDADVGTRGSPALSQTIMQCKNMSCGSQGSCGKKALAPSPCEKT